MIDEKLEADMEEVLEIVVLGRSARNGASLKNRQPLSVMYVAADHPLDSYYIDIIRDELNLKDVQFSMMYLHILIISSSHSSRPLVQSTASSLAR